MGLSKTIHKSPERKRKVGGLFGLFGYFWRVKVFRKVRPVQLDPVWALFWRLWNKVQPRQSWRKEFERSLPPSLGLFMKIAVTLPRPPPYSSREWRRSSMMSKLLDKGTDTDDLIPVRPRHVLAKLEFNDCDHSWLSLLLLRGNLLTMPWQLQFRLHLIFLEQLLLNL